MPINALLKEEMQLQCTLKEQEYLGAAWVVHGVLPDFGAREREGKVRNRAIALDQPHLGKK